MPRGRPMAPLELSDELRSVACQHEPRRSLPNGLVECAKMALACAEGTPNCAVVARMQVSNTTVGKWCEPYRIYDHEGLLDNIRSSPQHDYLERPRMSRKIPRYWVAIFLFFGTCSVAISQTQYPSCKTMPEEHRRVHETLLEYAVLAAAAYRTDDQWSSESLPDECPLEVRRRIENNPIRVEAIPDSILNAAKDALVQRAQECRMPEPKIEFEGKNVTCATGNVFQRLSLAFRYFSGSSKILTVDPTVRLLSGSGTLLKVFTKEEIEEMKIERKGTGETIYGVQGTDITKLVKAIKHFNTSIQQLTEGSCLFDFAVEVSKHFFTSHGLTDAGESSSTNAIVGHSLGGAIAQHVGLQQDLQTLIRRHDREATFRAYSFNSIGVNPVSQLPPHQKRIYSTGFYGDVLDILQLLPAIDTVQPGQRFRYGTHLRSISDWQSEGAIKRHGIRRVQEEICRCLDGTGTYEYGPYAD